MDVAGADGAAGVAGAVFRDTAIIKINRLLNVATSQLSVDCESQHWLLITLKTTTGICVLLSVVYFQ